MMLYVNGLSDSPNQSFRMPISDGTTAYFTLVYRPRIKAFYIDLTWQTININGLRVSLSMNIYEQYSNNLPFGLMCFSSDGVEPFLLTDFYQKRCGFYLLDSADLATLEALYNG